MFARASASTESQLLVFTAAPLLVVYLVLLLGTTLYAQHQLQDAAVQSIHAELEKRATALSYFYSERRADIDRMARDQAVTRFFTNRALGMSMEYGLRTSLLAMEDLAETMARTRTIDEEPIYKRIVVKDLEGEVLVDVGASAGQPLSIPGPLPADADLPRLLVGGRDGSEVYLWHAITYRDARVGSILARVDHDAAVKGFTRHKDDADDYAVTIAKPSGARSPLIASDEARIGSLMLERRHAHWDPIPGTPFEISVAGSSFRGGLLASRVYFVALVVLAVALLLLLGLMARQIQARERELLSSHDALAETNKQLRTSQKQLVHSEKMASLGTLAAGVAHEINNPVGFILGNLATLSDYQRVLIPLVQDYRSLAEARADTEPELLQGLEERLQGEDLAFLLEDMDSLVEDTVDGSRRVADIVSGLRSFAHGNDSKREALDVNECLKAALSLANNELKYKAEVAVAYGAVPTIRGSSGQITQVLVNLLVNAAQAIEGRGQVSAATFVAEGNVMIRVRDTGCGIGPEHLEKLFMPFYTTKGVGSGTGLGLSISQGIVESHGGSIRVESRVGRGTEMTVAIPVESTADV